jgi:DNA modification methylase
MKLERIKLDALTCDPANVRKHDQRNLDAIKGSLQRFGQQHPIIVDAAGVIRAGNGRYMAMRALGWSECDIVRSDLKGSEATAFAIADNRTAELATWDDDALAQQLAALQIEDEALALATGYDAKEIEALALDASELVEDEVPEPPADPITKPGDLWLLGDHRLLCGDSTKAEDVARLMDGRKADLCFTSPPYGAGNVAKLRDHYVRGATKRESFYDQHEDDPESWPSLMADWYDAFRPVSECIVCNVQMLADNKRALVAWLAERSADLCDVIVWDKVNAAPQMQANVLSNAFEFCFVFGGNSSRAIPFADFHGTLSNVLRLDPRGKNDQADKHRAVFPVELPAWFIQTLCKEARSVVDPFCGTGTTLVAAEQLGRTCYGMEISPAYCDVIVQRWETLTGRKATRA